MMKSSSTALMLIAFLAFSCSSKHAQSPASDRTSEKAQTFALPKVKTIASLPDSLQPKTILLDNMPKPKTVVIPVKEGGFYTRKYSNGDTGKIALSPPV